MAFIAFEGLDGAGKSTLMTALQNRLENQGLQVLMTREPGGTELGETIRKLLLSTEVEAPTALAELLLYQAIRAQHVEKKIQPALKNKAWVLCDRFTASSVAFQAGGRGVSRSIIDSLNELSTNGLQPDLWVLLDLSVETARKRMEGRELDRFEKENASFHEKVRNSYLQQAQSQPEKWLVLDAGKTPAELEELLLSKLKDRGLMS